VIRLVGTKIAGVLIVVFCVATASFVGLHAAPGGPFSSKRRVPPAIQRNVERAYHLDWPVWRQYETYMLGLARGDLGRSIRRDATVSSLVRDHVWPSLELGVLALAFAILFGVALGVTGAARKDRALDRGTTAISLVGISVPAFVLGPCLILVFALRLRWFPAARVEGIRSLVLPAVTLGMVYLGAIARITRASLVETMAEDYVRTARAKGLSEARAIGKHALRPGLLPVVSYLGPAIAYVITGSFVVETAFQVPGLGHYFVSAVSDRDYPVLAGLMVIYCLASVGMSFLVDVAHGLLDPRVRAGQ
jgi:oligopeptide transport system permease protein